MFFFCKMSKQLRKYARLPPVQVFPSPARGRVRTQAIVLGSILVLLFNFVTTTARASDQAAVDEATRAADRWLKLVDAGDYKQSWEAASTIFKNAVTEAQWAQQLGDVRKPLGALVSRKLKGAQ